MRMRTTWLVIALSTLLLLAACTEAEPSSSTADTASEPAAEETAAASEEMADETDDAAGGEVTGDVSSVLVFPETGPLAAVVGASIDWGNDAVVALWNELHPDRQVTLQKCNDEGNPERGLSCVERHVSEADVILGPHIGSIYAAAEPLLGEDVLSVVATPHALPDGSKAVFQAIPTAEHGMTAAIEYMEAQGWDKFGMLTSSDTTGNTARDAALTISEELGMELVSEEFDPASEDLTGQVNAIAAEDVDTLFIWSSGAQVVTALRAVQNVGLDTPVFLNYSSMSRALMELAAGALPEELLFTGSAAFVPETIEDPERRDLIEAFSQRYQEASGGDLPDWNAFAVSDAAWVAYNAALHGETVDEMASWLQSGEPINGFNGVYSYGPDDHIGLDENPVQILRWTGDGWEPAG